MLRVLRVTPVSGLALTIVACLAGCGGPNGPSPPPTGNIVLTCPADVHVDNVSGSSQAVSFAQPQATGGVPPISITCSPASGSAFPLGTTPVNCQATDGVRAAACVLSVTLVPRPPVLTATRFLAVGDSITAGENGIDGPPDTPCSGSPARGFGLPFIDLCHSYPSVLQVLLAARYATQTPLVFNRGERGQTTEQGLSLLPGYLAETHPDGLLLLEGVNDLQIDPDPRSFTANLRRDIQLARGSVRKIFLSTLTPLKPGQRGGAQALIPPANAAIRALAAEQGVVLVDAEAAFLARGDYSSLLSDDGEHCTPAGYRVLAETFLAAISATLEEPAPASFSTAVRRP